MPGREQVEAAEAQIVDQSKKIDYYVTEYSLELLAAKMDAEDFEVPLYQRADTWELERKSRFIESILMGLPIPYLLFWENPKSGKLEIVDGLQRLRAIHQFLRGELQLSELEKLYELEGFRFPDLLESRQRKIKNRSIRGIILNEHADEQARFDLFDRINTGSKIPNNAEVRRGAVVGPFLDLVIKLTGDARFTKLAPVSETRGKLRESEELVTRFFAYGDGLDDYKDRVGEFLFAYARRMTELFRLDVTAASRYEERFKTTMDFVDRAFPLGFRKAQGATTTPRARFEAIAIGSYLAIQERPTILAEPIDVTPWHSSNEFAELTGSDGANAKKRLQARIHFVRDKLLGAK
ncbi:MAG: DUF262 domain-containing protein [Bryobacteraceae bacterium]